MEYSQPGKPRESAVSLLVILFLIVANVTAAAQTAATRIAEIHDHLQKAAEYLKSNDSNSAVKELDAVLAIDPKNAEAYANLGVIAFFQRDYRNASQYLHKALAIAPSLVKTQALLGLCERRLGEPSAQALLEKSFPALKDKPLKIQVGMELAGIYQRRDELDRAACVMRSLVDLDPENIEILYRAQRLYFELADDTLNKLAILAPRSALMQQVIAERLVNDGDLKTATEHYRRALEINPVLSGVHYELAEAIFESSPNDAQAQAEAKKELQTAVKLDGDSAKTECVFARIDLKHSDMDGAYAHYSRALALDPGEAEAQIGLGRLLATMKKPQEASKYLRMAVQSDPLNGEAHYRLAVVCKTLELKDEAAKEFRLFREVKQTKKDVGELYRQMNRKPAEQEDTIPDAEP
ncbi:MAG TPA: tetratricopeptide repeat protein [Bryobacteraceae bacterium]|jgi:Tfp pilus assembly protein PilF|nr:tetratricopeptide repeat protein [Bryobacteraceae bacterium]